MPSEDTQFKPGNKMWQMAANPGRPRIYDSPQELWDDAVKYFEWCYDHPLTETKAFNGKEGISYANIPKMRAMSMRGFYAFTGISTSGYDEYEKRPEFSPICAHISHIIWTQKFEGASAELLNPSIIARELGLADKKEVEHSGGSVNFNVKTD